MSQPRANGFTVIEVLIAIMILAFGILVLASTAGGVTRMMGSGQRMTKASVIASSRLELLRNLANSTDPKCTAIVAGTGTTTHTGGFTERWTLSVSGDRRLVEVIVSYRSGPRAQADTVNGTLLC